MTDSADLEDITPDDSVAPVYLDSTPIDLGDVIAGLPALAEAIAALRETALAKLMAGEPLSEEEARTVIGM